MPYVFDTDMLTLYEEGHPRVVGRVAAHPPQEPATTVISVEEPLSGWFTMLRRVKGRGGLANLSAIRRDRRLPRADADPLVHGGGDRSLRNPAGTEAQHRQHGSAHRRHRPRGEGGSGHPKCPGLPAGPGTRHGRFVILSASVERWISHCAEGQAA